MQVVYERCCGLDVHKKTVVACILITLLDGSVQRTVRTFSTMTSGLLALADGLEGFVQPESGQTSWLLLPTVNTEAFSLALAVFAQEQGIGPNKHLALVMDQAGWHKSTALRVPQGLHLLFLPSHLPELQPAERLWPLSNEPLAKRVFGSLDDLEQVQASRCRWLQAHPEVIRARTQFHWWPASLNTTSTDLILASHGSSVRQLLSRVPSGDTT